MDRVEEFAQVNLNDDDGQDRQTAGACNCISEADLAQDLIEENLHRRCSAHSTVSAAGNATEKDTSTRPLSSGQSVKRKEVILTPSLPGAPDDKDDDDDDAASHNTAPPQPLTPETLIACRTARDSVFPVTERHDAVSQSPSPSSSSAARSRSDGRGSSANRQPAASAALAGVNTISDTTQ